MTNARFRAVQAFVAAACAVVVLAATVFAMGGGR